MPDTLAYVLLNANTRDPFDLGAFLLYRVFLLFFLREACDTLVGVLSMECNPRVRVWPSDLRRFCFFVFCFCALLPIFILWQLRNEESQEALAELAASPLMRLAASIDHVNAPLMWDVRLVAKFNWVRKGRGGRKGGGQRQMGRQIYRWIGSQAYIDICADRQTVDRQTRTKFIVYGQTCQFTD